jgi:C4-dicarboxylate-specific signal transduction histidine kinase
MSPPSPSFTFSISSRLTLGLVLLLGIAFLGLLSSLWFQQRLMNSLQDLGTRHIDRLHSVEAAVSHFLERHLFVREMLLNPESEQLMEYREEFYDSLDSYRAEMGKLRQEAERAGDAELLRILDSMGRQGDQTFQVMSGIVTYATDGFGDMALEDLRGTAQPLMTQRYQNFLTLRELYRLRITELMQEKRNEVERFQMLNWALFVVLAILGSLSLGVIRRSIMSSVRQLEEQAMRLARGEALGSSLHPIPSELYPIHSSLTVISSSLTQLEQQAQRIAQGDLGAEVKPRSEQDTLGRTFNQMAQSLRENERNRKELFWLREASDLLRAGMYRLNLRTQEFTLVGDAVPQILGLRTEAQRTTHLEFWPSSYAEFVLPDDRERVLKTLAEARQKQQGFAMRFQVRRSTEEGECWVAEMGRVVQGPGDTPYLLGVVQEITQQVRREEQLKATQNQLIQSTKMATMGEMLAMIAHQWRQPLATINAIAATVSLETQLQRNNPEKVITQLQKIQETSHFLSRTINDFRNFFRPDKDREAIQLSVLMERSLEVMSSPFQKHQVQFIRETQELPALLTHPNELQQVLLNLLKNALDVLVEREIPTKQIVFRLFSEHEQQVLELEDNAGGIPEDVLPQIFEPYFSTKSKLNGTGLGLYMSKMIIEDHLQGALVAENRTHGACFRVTIPPLSEQRSTELTAAN